MLGGSERFVEKLDSMFTRNATGTAMSRVTRWHTCMTWQDRNDLTQKWVRHILDTEYLDTGRTLRQRRCRADVGMVRLLRQGLLPGLSGYRPLLPRRTLFDRVTITPEGGKPFTITAPRRVGR